ncbi:MAG: (E)-4-hydroxy-3-methylbut-2-enyl-diphosphate synthase [Bacteroidales bacterium]|jgi:(E)-4-hydroxy-3-methylbut-2-enyl-diphosphate synthase|nr:(E)-4-hydroxy-3-methylbut-2-enyl-diphosphate synthase [Bacteroidales bacterium]
MRRSTHTVLIGDVPLGSEYPVRLQSMVNTDTMDTEATVVQAIRIAEAGGDYVRIAAPGIREAEQLANIRKALRQRGYTFPLVADIHFNPKAAETAARIVEKVRINPGNYLAGGRYVPSGDSGSEEAAETERMHRRLLPLIKICKQYGTAVRIGINHGSLSRRIVYRYGDTPAGMVESAMEFLRIFEAEQFRQTVISMKASNVRVMIAATRLLAKQMEAEHIHCPLHLGVTEAGEGEDGRMKSALGIGTLLSEGLGDTVRVSLTEAPEKEIPVARKIVDYAAAVRLSAKKSTPAALPPPVPANDAMVWIRENVPVPEQVLLLSPDSCPPPAGSFPACILKKDYPDSDPEDVCVKAACDFGSLLLGGVGDGVWINAPALGAPEKSAGIALSLLQACRLRMSKPEYISCPSCGRTLFDLQQAVARVKERTSHLKGLKIAVMGCIVNGPGEMADADYGYIGAGKGRITLYCRGKAVKRNLPEEEAADELVRLIRLNGDWHDNICCCES